MRLWYWLRYLFCLVQPLPEQEIYLGIGVFGVLPFWYMNHSSSEYTTAQNTVHPSDK